MAELSRLPTRFSGGMNNLPDNDLLGFMALPDPTRYALVFQDFTSPESINNVLKTETGAGSSSVSTVSPFRVGGFLTSTSAAVANSAQANQLTPYPMSPFSATGFIGARIRWEISNLLNMRVAVGVAKDIPNGKPLEIQDGYYLYKDFNSSQFVFRSSVGGVNTDSAFINPINSVQAGILYETIFFRASVDEYTMGLAPSASKESLPSSFWQATQTFVFPSFPVIGAVSPFFAFEVQTAVARSAKIDYFLVCQERWPR